MVLSVDGKSTKADLNDQSWASPEDQKHLSKLISENNLILMGGNTYELAKSHIKTSAEKLRIVVTRDPAQFSEDEIKDQLEFVNKPLHELISRLEDRGYNQMLLLSGENLNKEFFEQNFISEIYLTIEPKIFGSGKKMLVESVLDINLKLLSLEKLNENGTILLHYQVLK